MIDRFRFSTSGEVPQSVVARVAVCAAATVALIGGVKEGVVDPVLDTRSARQEMFSDSGVANEIADRLSGDPSDMGYPEVDGLSWTVSPDIWQQD